MKKSLKEKVRQTTAIIMGATMLSGVAILSPGCANYTLSAETRATDRQSLQDSRQYLKEMQEARRRAAELLEQQQQLGQ